MLFEASSQQHAEAVRHIGHGTVRGREGGFAILYNAMIYIYIYICIYTYKHLYTHKYIYVNISL